LTCTPRRSFAELQDGAEIFVRHHDGGLDPRLLDFLDHAGVRHVGRIVQFRIVAVGQVDL
jgi:hypothetical protein